MEDHKLNAAKATLEFIKPNQKIGLGAGSTIFHLIDLILKNSELAKSLSFASPSFKTREYLRDLCLGSQLSAEIDGLDLYIDSCDQLDWELNALKSGGGIHSGEKIMAAMATTFILMADESKFVEKLNCAHPLVLEILPNSLPLVFKQIQHHYPNAMVNLRMSSQKDGAVLTENGNLLVDINFIDLPALEELNPTIKMIPGVLDHSLFYKMAQKAVIAGKNGIKVINQKHLEKQSI